MSRSQLVSSKTLEAIQSTNTVHIYSAIPFDVIDMCGLCDIPRGEVSREWEQPQDLGWSRSQKVTL
jgi:hypothetical protein